MRKQKSHMALIAGGVVAGVAIVAVGAYFGGKAIYENGVSAGREAMSNEISNSVRALGEAVAEKAEFIQAMNTVFESAPTEINTESIKDYAGKLEELIGKTTDTEIQAKITELAGKWSDFQETYASEDNDKISEAFNALKLATEETAGTISEIYNQKISSAIDAL